MSEPIRVLQVVTKMDRGGLETFIMNIYRHIDREKIQFDFLTHRMQAGDYDDEITALGGKIYHVCSISTKNLFQYKKQLKQFFTEHREYRIVHSHLDSLSTLVLHAAKKAGVPVRIAHSHNTNFDKDIKIAIRYFSKFLLKFQANWFCACSLVAGTFMFGKKTVKNTKYFQINNAIDVDKFTYQPSVRLEVQRTLNLNHKFVVGHVGRFEYQKNHEFLIDVFNQVYKQNTNAVLLLIGRGKNQTNIKNRVDELHLSNAVRFLGVRSDISDLMQAMDVFVLPSRFEGLGIVLIEAQAAGLKCLASDIVVPREAKVTELLTYISLESSPKVWADEIIKCEGFAHKNTSEQIKQEGYDITGQAEKLQHFYLKAVNE